MLQTMIIGHIGADAESKNANGRNFITFRVAHSERYTDANGQQHDNTTWVDCILNGSSNLLPYLKKGTQVYVIGSTSLRTYSSPKDKCIKAGLTINVRNIELLGGKPEQVPSVLYRQDNGEQVQVSKYYFALSLARGQEAEEHIPLVSTSAQQFVADRNGCISIVQQTESF